MDNNSSVSLYSLLENEHYDAHFPVGIRCSFAADVLSVNGAALQGM
jgi:hypothetical protein